MLVTANATTRVTLDICLMSLMTDEGVEVT
jgi:hypothetical protein